MNEVQLVSLQQFDISLVEILWYILGAIFITFVIHSLVATYHWFTYGTERSIPLIATIIYNVVGGILLISMAGILLTL